MSSGAASHPAPLARRERQKTETRQSILDAARELFVAEGVEATTMRAVAARIGYTPTAIYHHFRDKDALITELCLLDFRSLGQALHKIGRIEDPVERLLRMGMAYADFAIENPSQYRFMFMTPSAHRETDASVKPDEDAYRFLRQTIDEGIACECYRPELTDAALLAQSVWGAIHGVISLWLTHRDAPRISLREPRESVRTTCEIMIRGALRSE